MVEKGKAALMKPADVESEVEAKVWHQRGHFGTEEVLMADGGREEIKSGDWRQCKSVDALGQAGSIYSSLWLLLH